MKTFSSETEIKYVIEVSWADRWLIYQRLNELDICCYCDTNQPLQVEINDPQILIQVWSVVRKLNASRQDLIFHLNDCWRLRHEKI